MKSLNPLAIAPRAPLDSLIHRGVLQFTGYTLLEIMITVIILGTIVAMAIPRLTYTFEKTRSAEAIHILESLLQAQKIYFFQHRQYASALQNNELEIDPNDFSSKNFNRPDIFNDANKVAAIKRNQSPDYTLSINDKGVIACSYPGSANIRKKIGF